MEQGEIETRSAIRNLEWDVMRFGHVPDHASFPPLSFLLSSPPPHTNLFSHLLTYSFPAETTTCLSELFSGLGFAFSL